MAIEQELQTYGNEAEFRGKFLVPLLRRLGFLIVVEYHGTREFGKDLVFGEIDRFHEVVYHALQAKYVASVSQTEVHDLVEDANEAFTHPFRHPIKGAYHNITTFCVANAGSISENARTHFFGRLHVPHGGHVRMFDGKALLALDRWATAAHVEAIQEQLMGLLIELRYNRAMARIIADRIRSHLHDDKQPLPLERVRLFAIPHYLHRPVVAAQVDTTVVHEYCHAGEMANRILDRVMAGLGTKENRHHLMEDVLIILSRLEGIADSLETALLTIIETLGPLAPV